MYAKNMVVSQRGSRIHVVFENTNTMVVAESDALNMYRWAEQIMAKAKRALPATERESS